MKKRLICLLLVLTLMFSVFSGLTVSAAGEETVTKRSVPTYLYSLDKAIELECLFTADLSEVAYVAPEDFLNHVNTVESVQTKNPDDTYSVTNKNGTMVVDPNADTIRYDDFEKLVLSDFDIEGSASESYFAKVLGFEHTGEIHSVTLDLAAYGIDILEYDGRVYIPLPTLNDIYMVTYNSAEYIDGNIYFTHSIDYQNGKSYYDRSSLFDTLERSPALADYTYRELCFMMDHCYGTPSLAPIASSLENDHFDSVLDTYDESTVMAKRLLKSTSKKDYFLGLGILGSVFYDGGHTMMSFDFVTGSNAYPDSAIAQYRKKC